MALTKFTEENRSAIINAIRQGVYASTAARLRGVSATLLSAWLKRGRDGDPAYLEFYEHVKVAEAEAEARAVMQILEAGQDTWQCNAWWLERKYPARWGIKSIVEQRVDAELRSAMEKLRGGLDPESFEKVIAVLSSSRVGSGTTREDSGEEEPGPALQ